MTNRSIFCIDASIAQNKIGVSNDPNNDYFVLKMSFMILAFEELRQLLLVVPRSDGCVIDSRWNLQGCYFAGLLVVLGYRLGLQECRLLFLQGDHGIFQNVCADAVIMHRSILVVVSGLPGQYPQSRCIPKEIKFYS